MSAAACIPRGTAVSNPSTLRQSGEGERLNNRPETLRTNVGSGSKADLGQRIFDVCFTPLIADIHRSAVHVRFVPIADLADYSITSSAWASSNVGTLRPSAFAVFRLMMS